MEEKTGAGVASEDPLPTTQLSESDAQKGTGLDKGADLDDAPVKELGGILHATEDDILEAKEAAASFALEDVRKMMKRVVHLHDGDPNFPFETMQGIREFLANEDIMANPRDHQPMIEKMRLQAALIVNNSPYAEVRAVVDNHDDPTLPVSTIRSWVIGLIFAGFMTFVNQLFSIRMPQIVITSDVAQLLAYPVGKAWERWVPRGVGFTMPFFNERVELNPGRFNKKEHMLIAIMAGVSVSMPYSNYIFWVQYLPMYFNQPFARSFGYMFVNNLATNFIGYGLAGIVRRFLVYPAYCVWPASLVTIALNSALHNDENPIVPGPFRKMFSISRYKLFMIAFCAMFVYFWIPGYAFTALSMFAWMTWIAPNNRELNVLTGMVNGMGLFNPLPTFDWNIVSFMFDPLMYPSFSIFNLAVGMWISGLAMLAIWYTNTWNTGYLPINTNQAYDHFGMVYNVSQTIDERGLYDHEKYMKYSAPYLSPATMTQYTLFFCIYSAVIAQIILYHRYEVALGFKGLWRSIRWGKKYGEDDEGEGEFTDVHSRLMRSYTEVSEWWYMALLVASIVLGVIGLASWPTNTSPAIPLYGVALCIVFIVPTGIVTAMTGVPISLNVLAEFFGGLIAEGNALALNFFKCYGYVTCYHTIVFSNDLKLAHYLKIPPRITFWAQVIATLMNTIVSTGVMVFQMGLPNVCTTEAPMRFQCPVEHSFFTSSIMWGTIGPRKTFGAGAPYQWLLLGFPVGAVLVVAVWLLKRQFPHIKFFRQINIAAALFGGCYWGIYNFSYMWPAVPVAWFSWHFIRKRYLAFWSKYNYVLSAAFSSAIALSAILMFFTVSWTNTEANWWGNTVLYGGCETLPCTLKTLLPGERFFPWWNNDDVPAP